MMTRFFRDNSGAAAVEFVLCMPFLVTLSIGVSEMGRGLWCYHTLIQTTRDATRFLSHLPPDTTDPANPAVPTAYKTLATNLVLHGTADGSGPLLIPSDYGSVTTSYAVVNVAGTWSSTQPAQAHYVTTTSNLTFTSPLISWFGANTSLPISVSHSERMQTD